MTIYTINNKEYYQQEMCGAQLQRMISVFGESEIDFELDSISNILRNLSKFAGNKVLFKALATLLIPKGQFFSDDENTLENLERELSSAPAVSTLIVAKAVLADFLPKNEEQLLLLPDLIPNLTKTKVRDMIKSAKVILSGSSKKSTSKRASKTLQNSIA